MITDDDIFLEVKDPADAVWYAVTFANDLIAVAPTATVAVSTPTVSVDGDHTTAGDSVTGSPLVVTSVQLQSNGHTVAYEASYGAPGVDYSIGIDVTLTDGSVVRRSKILPVRGR